MDLPPDFTVEQLPRSTTMILPDTSLSFQVIYDKTENILQFRNEFDLNRGTFDREEYPGIHEFFQKIYAITGQRILLKKKS